MAVVEDPPAAVPEWVVSFGDMMSLLLTFFIMLVSMSELRKDDDKFQSFMIALKSKFGDDVEKMMLGVGTGQPAHSHSTKQTFKRQTKWDNSTNFGAKQKGAQGAEAKVKTIRPGTQTVVGAAIAFAEDSAELTEDDERNLRRIADELVGKPQRIEVRGHSSKQPLSLDSTYRDHWDLAYARCRQVMQFLTGAGIDPRRIRLGVAAANEPTHRGQDPLLGRENSRVEVIMLGEVPDAPSAARADKLAPPAPVVAPAVDASTPPPVVADDTPEEPAKPPETADEPALPPAPPLATP